MPWFFCFFFLLTWKSFIFLLLSRHSQLWGYLHALLLQSCPTLCDPMDCSPLGSFVHGILQARILEWVAIPFSRRSSLIQSWWILYHWGTRNTSAWSWNSNTLATSCKELTNCKRPWCWEGLGAEGEVNDRGWDGWMASPTRWAWVWVNYGNWWWTGGLAYCDSWGHKELNTTEWLDWTELKL